VRQQLLASVGAPVSTLAPCEAQEHEHSALLIELWKQTITVQQHFNDLQLRIRNFAITVFGAVIGATAFALKENLQLSLGGYTASLATMILLGGALSWLAFYFMDRLWYHMLLVGSVKHGMALERELRPHFPNALLTHAIGKNSPIQFGFAVALPIALAAMCGLYRLIPTTGNALVLSVLSMIVLLIPVSLVAIHTLTDDKKLSDDPAIADRQRVLRRPWVRALLIIGLLVLSIPSIIFWDRGSVLLALIAGGAAATAFLAVHEYAGTLRMHSGHKVDIFYFAGLLVYLGIAICMQRTTHSLKSSTLVVTETKSTSAAPVTSTGTNAVQTSTSKTTTQP
jgi:hypothetical protein